MMQKKRQRTIGLLIISRHKMFRLLEGGSLYYDSVPNLISFKSHNAAFFQQQLAVLQRTTSSLFSFLESRRILLPVVLHHIHLHLRQQKELLICSGILGSIFSIVKTSSLVVTPHSTLVSVLILCYCSQELSNTDHFVHFSVRDAFIGEKKVPK